MSDRFHDLGRDLRYAVRLLARSPGYAVVVTLVLALGIAANLVSFGLFQALALTPLAGVPGSASLQVVFARTTSGRDVALSYPEYRYLRDHARSFDGLAGSFMQGWTVGRGADAQVVFGELVSGNYFDVLGVRAQIGRTLHASDAVASGQPVAVLADSLWRRTFAADPAIVGRTVRVGPADVTVVGVAARDFRGTVSGIATELFIPYEMKPDRRGSAPDLDWLYERDTGWVYAFGRLRPGTTAAQARAEVAILSDNLRQEQPRDGFADRALLVPIRQSPQGAQTYMLPAIGLMGAMSFLLLLVVCANVAGLVLVRALGRQGEIAARLAVGATPGRVVRLLLIETFVLAVPGAGLALWLPRLVEPFLYAAQPSTAFLPLYFNFAFAPAAVAAFALACASAILAGVAPAIKVSRLDVATALKHDLSPRGSGRSRVRGTLVVAQVAMSVLLLVGTALVARSLEAARRSNPGFDVQRVAAVTVDTFSSDADSDGRRFYAQLLEALRADPAIESASLMKDRLLMLMEFNTAETLAEGYEPQRDEDLRFLFNIVGTDHFRTLHIPLAAGREFEARDDESAPPVVVVNETLARRYWGEPAVALGKRVRVWDEWRTVVGVAHDIKYTRLNERPRPYLYLPHEQAFNGWMLVLARGRDGGPVPVDLVRRHVRALDAGVPILEAAPLAELTRLGVGVYDLTARTLAMVGAVAVALMALGVYGLVAYTVKQSGHEIGIRMAVGASRARIVRRYAFFGVRLAAVGAALGIGLALASASLIASLLFGVSATDAVSFTSAAAAVLVVSLAASLVPAWRGSRADPGATLRRT